MADNTEVCSNCGTLNPAGQDFCIKCHQPLTASAEEGVRENLEAEDRGGLFGVSGTATQGSGLDVGVMGGGMTELFDPVTGEPNTSLTDRPEHEGLPRRHS